MTSGELMKTLCTLIISAILISSLHGQTTINERISVDATDAARNFIHAKVTIPVQAGPVTIVYPKWIPGNHRPTGPIANLTGVHFKAGNQDLEWQRDLVDMYAFHLQIPQGTHEIEASLDLLSYNGKSSLASSKVIDLLWNQVVFYPQGVASDAVQVTASIRLPEGWKYGTALTPAHESGSTAEFQPVSLTRLVDSPLIAGQYYRQIQLSPAGEKPVHVIDMVGETEDAIQITEKDLASYKQLIAESGALFGSRHYEKYHFLWTLSDQTAHHGLEHHESSDNGTGEDVFSDPNAHDLEADLLPHEFTHSWNGKHRRPAGLVTPNYQEPMKGDLLWVYEGMTDYWGNILAARVGLRSAEQFRDNLAATAAMLDHRVGRTWRPLQDTATSVQTLFSAPPQWASWRRSADYYPEGYLIWLDVDTTLRKQSNGQKSLNDFCKIFFGGQGGVPNVIPYKFEDVASTLNQVVPYDWAKFLRERLDSRSAHAPLGGIENGGWKLVYTDQKNITMDAAEKSGGSMDLSFSIGAFITKEGDVRDVIPGSPAFNAGLGPGMSIIGVNGRKFSKDAIHNALRAGVKSQQPLTLLAENGDYIISFQVDYHGGDKYPHLVRADGQADLLGEITKPMTK